MRFQKFYFVASYNMVWHWTPKPVIISCIRSSPTGGNVLFAVVNCFQYSNAISANFVQTVKNSNVKLTFIGCSGLSRNVFYLYMVTSAGLSATLRYAHAYTWERHGLCTVMSVPCTSCVLLGCATFFFYICTNILLRCFSLWCELV